MNKKALYGREAREKILSGATKINDAVRVTLGPKGRCVLISKSIVVDYGVQALPISVSKDGWTVATQFDITDDPFERAGVLMIKEVTGKTVTQAGDGTTSSCILAHAILSKGIELVEKGANPVELKRAIDKAVDSAVEQLRLMAVPIKGDIDRIRQVATISANNDQQIGDMIADAFNRIGEEGIIDLEAGTSVNTEIKIADGYKWDNGWISPYFINKKEKQTCEFENPLILLYDKRINHHTQVDRALTMSLAAARPLLIICEDAVEQGLAYMAINNIQGRVQVGVVKSPGFGESRREAMEDIAILTGGTYISDTKGVGITEIEPDHFGQADKVVITKDETIIIGGRAKGEDLENHVNELRMNLAQAKNEDDRAPIEKRIAKLKGGVAVISVGAATETEMKEKLDRFDDSVRAVKSALSEGFIVGGGTAFLRVKTGNEIIDSVLSVPLRQICENAGVDADQIITQVRNAGGNIGYNAKTDQVHDLLEDGIIDAFKVLRCALTNAASSAGTILTTECLIVDQI